MLEPCGRKESSLEERRYHTSKDPNDHPKIYFYSSNPIILILYSQARALTKLEYFLRGGKMQRFFFRQRKVNLF